MSSNNLMPMMVCVIFVVIFFVMLDSFMMGSVQSRSGPYMVGWFGLLQSVDDGMKLYLNRVIMVQSANGLMFMISPLLFFTSSYLLWAQMPYCYNQDLAYLVDLNYSILFQLLLSSLSLFALMMAGWSSFSS